MRFVFLLIFLEVFIFAKDSIRFSPLPMESASKTLQIFTPFVKYLEEKSGKEFKYIYKSRNIDVMEGLKNGEIDIAYFGPLPFVKLKEEYPHVIPIAQYLEPEGKKTYTCTFFKRKGDNINFKNIKNKKAALTHKYSTCGYAFMYELLQEQGIESSNMEFKYIGSHYNAIVEVIMGDYDVGGVKTSIFNKFKDHGIEAIGISKPNPGLMVVANGDTLSTKEIEKFKQIILSIDKEEKKNWYKKIKKETIDPDLELLKEYKERIKKIELKDEK